jgi:predicted alpha-1,2-mannosidase
MYKMLSILKMCFVISIVSVACKNSIKRPVDYVDPFICTEGDHGQWDPSATVPFGMVKLGADTYPSSLTGDGDFAHSGYNYSDTIVRAFSHFHKGSSGGGRIGDRAGRLSIMPFSHEPVDTFLRNPLAVIDKKSEKASAGYYSVKLKEDDILTEFSATAHTGIHRYPFANGKPVPLFLNEGNLARSASLSVKQIDSQHLEGFLETFSGVHFIVEFSEPMRSGKTWNGKEKQDGTTLDKVNNGGLICDFGDLKGKPLVVKIGLSLTSSDAAKSSLKAECTGWNFDKVKDQASQLWNNQLSNLEVKGNDEYKTIFYTALFHTCFLPTVISDPDGSYPGLDHQVHKAEGYKHYYDYAFWDSFRTKYPLYSLFAPGAYRDIVKSLRDVYEQADNCAPFPDSDHKPHGPGFEYKGKDGYQPFSSCRHEHMLMVVIDAWSKGLFDLDMKAVYPFLKKETLIQMPEKYDAIGYIPARPDQTGEYCWDNWCVAQVAKSMGNQQDYDYLMKRSEYWRNTWDPSIKYFRARAADGSWLDFPEDPAMNREKYTYEGSKWQYRWNILHDVPSLIEKFGGKERFVVELEYFFDNDLYTAGNQIDLHAPFLFNLAGAPWLSQKWAHKILTEPIVQRYGTHNFFPKPIFDRVYKTTPDGYLEEMDDDYGCMSAWYAMSAMGLFQVCPGNPVYQLTSPIFDEITIHFDPKIYAGKSFIIKANKLSKENYYIQSATLNGKPFSQSWITHEEIVKGGKLIFEMGPNPNKKWGVL